MSAQSNQSHRRELGGVESTRPIETVMAFVGFLRAAYGEDVSVIIVVQNSREEHAYRTAREKLELIASTMVDAERFENVFSRVMSLRPPEQLQHVLIAGDRGPLSQQNQDDLARMVYVRDMRNG